MPDQLNPERIMQTGLGFWGSKTLLSAIEMGLFTELSRGPERFDSLCDASASTPARLATFSTLW